MQRDRDRCDNPHMRTPASQISGTARTFPGARVRLLGVALVPLLAAGMLAQPNVARHARPSTVDPGLAAVAARHPEARLPVIVLTGVTSSHEIDRARSTGADRCLSKPIDVAEFLGVLREVTAPTRASGTAG